MVKIILGNLIFLLLAILLQTIAIWVDEVISFDLRKVGKHFAEQHKQYFKRVNYSDLMVVQSDYFSIGQFAFFWAQCLLGF